MTAPGSPTRPIHPEEASRSGRHNTEESFLDYHVEGKIEKHACILD